MEYHLHKWSVVSSKPYQSPESQHRSLQGYRDDEDKSVTTSTIVDVNGKRVTTYSGSVYILEDIDPDYLKWIAEQGYIHDPDNPIKDKRK